MRKGRREVLLLLIVFLTGIPGRAVRNDTNKKPAAAANEFVGLTIELSWSLAAADPAERGGAEREQPRTSVSLAVTEGRVAEAVPWPPPEPFRCASKTEPAADGSWPLGTEAAGHVRARVEAALGADLIVRRGSRLVRIPVAAILERPQHTPDQSSLIVSVERLPWDSLMVDLVGEAEQGVVAPLATLPVSLKYNILWPEASEVTVRTTAVLRPIGGGETLWRTDQREVVAANRPDPPSRNWQLEAPAAEGTYVLEIHAAWEPSGTRESSRLGRLIRRRKTPQVASSATRRVVLAVVAPRHPAALPVAATSPSGQGRETEVDAVDLGRIRTSRFAAWGRSPAADADRTAWKVPSEVILDAGRKERERDHERLRNLISRPVAEAANLEPADDGGLAWSAASLRARHPGRPHRLSLTVIAGDPSSLGVALVDSGAGGKRPRILLDACASGPPILKQGPAVTFSWLVWPDTAEPLLIVLNRNSSASVRLGSARLTELDGLPPPPVVRMPNTPDTRTVGLYLTGANALDRFGGGGGEQGLSDDLAAARNLVNYTSSCGASLVVLSERLADRAVRRALRGQVSEDSTGPDRLELVLRLLGRQGSSAWLELDLQDDDALPGLPPPDSVEALRTGLVRVDRQGLADGPTYHPLHPEVRKAMKRRVELALRRPGDGSALTGLLVQLGRGPTLLGTPDTGMDDATYKRFVQETFGPEIVEGLPGLKATDPDRFSARAKYLAGVGRMPWLTWRSRAIAALYTELADAARGASPGAVLALATPGLHGGAAGAEARRIDLAGLAPSQAWRSVGLDLEAWPSGPGAPIVLRGVELSTDPLARDLATSPDLDSKIATRRDRGVLLTMGVEPANLTTRRLARHAASTTPGDGALPAGTNEGSQPGSSGLADERLHVPLMLETLPLGDGATADEPLEHALAAFDAQWMILAAPAVAGHEDRLRRFATVMRCLPAWQAQPGASPVDQQDHGVSVRSLTDPSQTYLAIANDTPYPIRLAGVIDAPGAPAVEDLGRNLRLAPQPVEGGRQLVIDLPPFGVSAIRVAAPRVQLASLTPYPSEAVLTSMEARYHELTNQLARLNRGSSGGLGEPPNSGFEPDVGPPIQQTRSNQPGSAAAAESGLVAGGWRLEGESRSTIAIDESHPHSGHGSLKLTAAAPPASVLSGNFVPHSASSMFIQAFFRASADSRLCIWIEGEAGGQPYLRRSELTVGAEWQARAVRASDLPAGGLDSARLRFELLTPGTIWIDDLRVLGEPTPKAVRLNAQRTLLAAMQAYRAQHYAEFARLSSSHWARHPSVLAATRQGSPTQLSETASPGNAGAGSAAATALSPDRRLR